MFTCLIIILKIDKKKGKIVTFFAVVLVLTYNILKMDSILGII